MKPIVKWAGGKRQLLPVIKEMMPKNFGRYYEPFFGGGALYCELKPNDAVINDFNKQLINVYQQVKDDVNKVCAYLKTLESTYNECTDIADKDNMYYTIRSIFNSCIKGNIYDAASASRFIFLNKAGFNGLYRVNISGEFNVPPAHRKTIKLFDAKDIALLSEQLGKTRIMCGDFEKACMDAKEGDFIFFDSPYYDTFDTYQAGGFSEVDHLRLFGLFKKLSDKGVYCMLTNNDCDFIKYMYKNYNIKEVDVKRMINCDSKKRTGKEIIITNY